MAFFGPYGREGARLHKRGIRHELGGAVGAQCGWV